MQNLFQYSVPWGVIWVPSNRPHAGHFSQKNDNLDVQYEDVHDLGILLTLRQRE